MVYMFREWVIWGGGGGEVDHGIHVLISEWVMWGGGSWYTCSDQ